MKLGTKIFLIVILLMVFASGLSGTAVYFLNRSQTETSIGQTQTNSTMTTLDVIDRFFSERYGDSQVFARQESIQSLLATSSTTSTTSIAVLENEYRSIINIYGAWDAFIILDTHGAVRISTEKEYERTLTHMHTVEQELFRKAQAGDVAYSDFYHSSFTHKPTVAFAAPIRSQNKDGTIVGVAMGFVDWKVIEEILASAKVDAYLFNKEGEQIATGIRTSESPILNKTYPPLLKAQQGEKASSLRVVNEEKGSEVLASFASESGYFDYRGNGWILILEQPTKEVFADAQKSASIIIVLFFLGGIFFTICTVALFNLLVVHPIRYLTEVTEKIARGERGMRASITTKDELGILAHVFNQMAENIESAQRNLEQKVQERTASLDQKIEQLDALNKHMIGRELRMAELKKEIAILRKQDD